MLNARAYREFNTTLTNDMASLSQIEVTYQNDLFVKLLPVELKVETVEVGQVYAAAMARPFQGKLLSEWTKSIETARMTRIRDAVRIGYVENESTSKIVQRIRGTRAKGFSDGLIEIDRRNAESIVRTAVSHTAGFARDKFYQANDDLIKSLMWVSTIDSRTSKNFCIPRDHKQYDPKTHTPIGHKMPWGSGPGAIHWCCRSTSVPVLKSLAEILGIDGIEDFKPTTRASLDGQIPAQTSYLDWINRQSAARQDQVLGVTRGKLLRSGGLKAEDLYNQKGQFIDLETLRERSSKAFANAGL
jgi:hypothetical protein